MIGRIGGKIIDRSDNIVVVDDGSKDETFVRAEKKIKELKEKGHDVKIGDLLNDIKARDERDTNRSVAPMVAAEGAICIDSTTVSAQEVYEQLIQVIEKTFDI